MSEEIQLQPTDPLAGLVKVTQDEAYAWMFTWGRVTTLTIDGELYRVLEPYEGRISASPTPPSA